MSFTDYIFFPLMALLLLIYFLIPKKGRWIVLLIASLLFYSTYGVEVLPFALFAILIAWGGGLWIRKRYEKMETELKNAGDDKKLKQTIRETAKKHCKYILWVCVALILGVLVYSKTQRWLAEIPGLSAVVLFVSKIYQQIIHLGLRVPILRWFIEDAQAGAVTEGFSFFVPLGISYYTMSLIGYLADVYWRKEQAEKNVFRLALFALYFPKILEGPISKHRMLAKQLEACADFDYIRLCHGLQRMLWGYFKKLCIADRLNLMVTTVFGSYETMHGSVLLMAAFFGAFQLYCDFSGCMDMGLGLSEILGIELEENFRQPFFSESAPEFWRRWHMTLGTWFKDYIYMPFVVSPKLINFSGKVRQKLGKRAGKTVMSIIPTAVVWMLTGIWHGTGWNYILWGVYWGTWMILSTVFEPEIKKVTAFLHIDTATGSFRIIRILRTFLLFVGSRLITLSGTIEVMKDVFSSILFRFGPWQLFDKSIYNYGLDSTNFWLALLLIIFLLVVESRQDKGVVLREKIDALPVVWRWLIYLGGIFFVLIFGIYGAGYNAGSFVYMNY